MGSAIWVEVYNRSLKETADDCCKLHRLDDQLDRLAVKLGVPRLSEFYDWTEMAHASDAEMKALEAIERGEEPEPSFRNLTDQSISERQATGDWFDPAKAVTTLQTLRKQVAQSPSVVELPARGDDVARYRDELLDEFNLVQQILQRAITEGQRFRLLIVP